MLKFSLCAGGQGFHAGIGKKGATTLHGNRWVLFIGESGKPITTGRGVVGLQLASRRWTNDMRNLSGVAAKVTLHVLQNVTHGQIRNHDVEE
jgi:hypothetical protein